MPDNKFPEMNPKKAYKYYDYLLASFAVFLLVSNIASSAKIIDLRIDLFGLKLAVDGGTLLFPLTYVLGDLLTEVYGFKAARKVIWTGFALTAFSALVFFVLGLLPAEAAWEAEGSAAYKTILGGMTSGGIVLASLAAFLCGEFTNSVIHSKVKVIMKGRRLWIRTIGSSLIGELLDSAIFVGIAVLAGVFPKELFLSLVVTNYILKVLIEAFVFPLTWLAARKLKQAEGIDTYDVGINYNIFGK